MISGRKEQAQELSLIVDDDDIIAQKLNMQISTQIKVMSFQGKFAT